MVYKKYDNYKESGVSWIGKIPEGWDVRRLKDAYSSTNSGEVIDKGFWNTGNELLYTCQKTPMASDFDAFPKFKRTSKHDLLLTRNATPYIFIPFENAIYSNVVQRIVMHNKFDKRFVKRALECGVNAEQVNGDTIPSWNMQVWNNISFAFPCISEQKLISDFLDEKTSNIDKRIELLQQKSEKYKTLRKNLISHIVTHGLNSDVKMKDSGIERLGEIPDHREMVRIKDILSILTDYTANGSFADLAKNVTYLEEESYAKLIRLTDLRENLTNTNCYYVDEFSYNYLSKSKLFGGEVLIANVGANSGYFCEMPTVNYKATLAPNMFLIRTNKKIIQHYFYYFGMTDFSQKILTMKAQSSAQPKLNKTDVKTISIPLPPKKEQQEIINYLDDKTSQIDKILIKIDEEIEKLKELRKVLINDAVTGKIKVI